MDALIPGNKLVDMIDAYGRETVSLQLPIIIRSPDEAVNVFRNLELSVKASETSQIQSQIDWLACRFRQGQAIDWLFSEAGYGDRARERVSSALGISERSVYEILNVYRYCGGEISTFFAVLQDAAAEFGPKGISWRHIRTLGRQRSKDQKAEETLDQYEYHARMAAEKRDELTAMFDSLDEDQQDEALGIIAAMQANQPVGEHAKKTVPRSEDYENYLRSRACCVTGRKPVDVHHIEQGGVGMKGSSFACIPVHRSVHTLIEDKGHAFVERTFGISFAEMVAQELHRWITGVRIKWPQDISPLIQKTHSL